MPIPRGVECSNAPIRRSFRAGRSKTCREVAQSLGFNTAVADSAAQIGERKPDAVIVIVTGYGTVQSAVQAMKNGAYDYVTKPFSMEELRLLLERVSGHLKLNTENRTLREKIKSAASSVGRRRWKSSIASSAKPRTAAILCSSWARAVRARRWWHAPSISPALPRQTVCPGGLRLAGSHPDRKRTQKHDHGATAFLRASS
jgi:CheY-like chemotaxis protein